MKVLFLSDTHNSIAYLRQAAHVATADRNIRAIVHLGDVGKYALDKMGDIFRGWETFIVPGNHDPRSLLEQYPFSILHDGIIPAKMVTYVIKELPRVPVAGRKYENRLVNLLTIARSLGNPVILLSHCGGKVACFKWYLQVIEGGHVRATARVPPDLEIHGHKHPSSPGMYVKRKEWWPMYNLAEEGNRCYNAAFNLLVLDTRSLVVEVKNSW